MQCNDLSTFMLYKHRECSTGRVLFSSAEITVLVKSGMSLIQKVKVNDS